MSTTAAARQHGGGRRRMLLVHAHPDDETITTGGVIARYLAEGVEVTVVTCTLGEEGEVIGRRWAGLVVAEADQLGGYRVLELTNALAELGGVEPVFLGGAGRWRDSGMAGTPAAANPRAFVNADRAQAEEQLAEIIRERRPHVVITYDADGGYGHPDHIEAHRLTMAALESAAVGPGSWQTPKVYLTVTEDDALAAGLARMGELPAGWTTPAAAELPAHPAATITTEVDISVALNGKLRALAAHATQVEVAPGGRAFTLSNLVAQPVLDREHFILVRGALGERDARGRESDLFGGLEFPAAP
ncbi:N-acetyl-1-D-myo-inositol-2-amino-2-deoxy-alpha-D-glucopyranoside deacetylase [Tomitella biformata]|uniref:N-acetyl-1-D-myo-inositol-2-amino-2-deoxy-alpha- D-glucopyranoside deacetylase n=1 Tax=Tomitella biformata TaxID=630403 RepID=UPI0004638849|nr:N-acetyl-1-D-myo-inositol-2-amino-2-deoxy-alpha-D-glucopyranoside deacetylase [Tomitella biformata]